VPGQLPLVAWESTKWVEKKKPETGGDAGGSSAKTAVNEAEKDLEIIERAAKSRKPILLYFTKDKCDDCRTMENLVLRQPIVVEASKTYHAVMLVEDFITKDLLKRYAVEVAPTLVILDYRGTTLAKATGRQSPRRLTALLKDAAAKNARAAEEEDKKAGREKAAGGKPAAGEKKAPGEKKQAPERKAKDAEKPKGDDEGRAPQ
jgi:thioredoxin-related protein